MPTVHEIYQEGEKLKDAGQYEPAVVKFEEALKLDDSFVLGHLALAVLYGKLNRHDDAIAHGRRAVELEPNEAFNYTALSVTFQRAFAGTRNQQYIYLAEEAKARAHTLAGH